MLTRESLVEYFNGSYKDKENGSGLFNIPGEGLIRIYQELGKADKKRVDELARLLSSEIKGINPPKDVLDDKYALFDNYIKNLYLIKKYKELKKEYKRMSEAFKFLVDFREHKDEIFDDIM